MTKARKRSAPNQRAASLRLHSAIHSPDVLFLVVEETPSPRLVPCRSFLSLLFTQFHKFQARFATGVQPGSHKGATPPTPPLPSAPECCTCFPSQVHMPLSNTRKIRNSATEIPGRSCRYFNRANIPEQRKGSSIRTGTKKKRKK